MNLNSSSALKMAMYDQIVEQAYWLGRAADYVCEKGCAHCCTQSVTMTTLEGQRILHYLQSSNGTIRLKIKELRARRQDSSFPSRTINHFARYCLEGKEDVEGWESRATWNLAQCLFLENGCCSIYPVRPFACRAMVSQKACQAGGSAEMAPILITLNSIWLQIIEHVDSGGLWGNLLDILEEMTGVADKEGLEEKSTRLLKNQRLPGFLIPPNEQEEAQRAIAGLFQSTIHGQPFSRLLKQASRESV